MSKKQKGGALSKLGIPELNLKGDDFIHEVPEHLKLEMIIEWKQGNAEKEIIGPLKAFAIEDGKLKIINQLIDYIYAYPINELRRAYLLPCE